jgi:predicted RecA/RadA family phage recombinase
MSTHAVNAGRRMSIVADRAIAAGDLIYFQGFYGTADDDAAVGDLVALILDGGVRDFKNIFGGTIPRGTKVFAAPTTAPATTLKLYPAASVPSGANPVGRVWATGVASAATATLRVALFHPNSY